MGTRNKKVDAYIASTPDWAQPILASLRETVHGACPDVEEEIKLRRPAFMYRGKILAGMSAFKEHCAFYFWNGQQVVEDKPSAADGDGMASQFGRFNRMKDLPAKKALVAYVKKAMALLEDGVTPRKA